MVASGRNLEQTGPALAAPAPAPRVSAAPRVLGSLLLPTCPGLRGHSGCAQPVQICRESRTSQPPRLQVPVGSTGRKPERETPAEAAGPGSQDRLSCTWQLGHLAAPLAARFLMRLKAQMPQTLVRCQGRDGRRAGGPGVCACMRKTPRRWERPRAASRLERLGQRDLRASPGRGHCGRRALWAEGIVGGGHCGQRASPHLPGATHSGWLPRRPRTAPLAERGALPAGTAQLIFRGLDELPTDSLCVEFLPGAAARQLPCAPLSHAAPQLLWQRGSGTKVSSPSKPPFSYL